MPRGVIFDIDGTLVDSGFRSGGWKDADLAGAIEIYDGPADLLANYASSVIGGKAE